MFNLYTYTRHLKIISMARKIGILEIFKEKNSYEIHGENADYENIEYFWLCCQF